MASIHKGRNGKYRVCWREADGSQRSRTCPNRSTAKELKVEVERSIALGQAWGPGPAADAPTLTEMCQAFLNDRARVLAASTLNGRRCALTVFLRFLRTVEPTGPLSPALLTRERLAGFYDYLRGERRNTELSAVQRVKMIQGLWRWLEDHDDFRLHVGRARMIDLPDARPELRPHAPTWTEVDAMIGELNMEWHKRLVALLRFTGLRKSQGLRLEWSDFNLRRAVLTVRPELGKSRQERVASRQEV